MRKIDWPKNLCGAISTGLVLGLVGRSLILGVVFGIGHLLGAIIYDAFAGQKK